MKTQIFQSDSLNEFAACVLPLDLVEAHFYDRPYDWEGAKLHLAKYRIPEMIPGSGNPYIDFQVKQKFMTWYMQSIVPSIRNNEDLVCMEEKAYMKWYGPQGGTPTDKQILQRIQDYYVRVSDEPLRLPQPSAIELDQLFLGCDLSENFDLLSSRHLYNKYKGDKKSNAGLTSWSDRRDKSTRVRAISQAMKFPTRIDPAVIGTRDQRQKNPPRTIFMDSFANYFREVRPLYVLEQIWKNSDHVAWRGDRFVEKYFQAFCRNKSVTYFEFDYETLDTWVQNQHAQWVWRAISLRANFTERLKQLGQEILDAVFKMPVVLPQGVILETSHSLFSGIYPTNPLETPLNLLIQIMWVNREVSKMVGRRLVLDRDYAIVILGDDALIAFDDQIFPDNFDRNLLCTSAAEFVWNNFHMMANASKQRVSQSSGWFCKRQFRNCGKQVTYPEFGGLQVTKSIYPLVLVFLSNFEPEDGPMDNKAQTLIKLWQTFDNAYAHPMWKCALTHYFDIVPELHFTVSDDDIAAYNAKGSNSWRIRLYGEKFDISKSPSAQVWLKLLTK